MDFLTILEGIKTDLHLSIDELIHHIKVLKEDVEQLKVQLAQLSKDKTND